MGGCRMAGGIRISGFSSGLGGKKSGGTYMLLFGSRPNGSAGGALGGRGTGSGITHPPVNNDSTLHMKIAPHCSAKYRSSKELFAGPDALKLAPITRCELGTWRKRRMLSGKMVDVKFDTNLGEK